MAFLSVLIGLGIVVWGAYMRFWAPEDRRIKVVAFVLLVCLVVAGATVALVQQAQAHEQTRLDRDAQQRRDDAYAGQIRQLQQQLEEESATMSNLLAAFAPKPLPPPPTLILHDVYGESWGLSRSGDSPVNLETASSLSAPVGIFHRIDPCVLSAEGLSTVWLYLTYPPDVEVRIDKRLWQEWPGDGNRTYAAAFGSLNPGECSVKGMPDGSGPVPMEFKPVREGPLRITYRVTGRVAQTQVSLGGETRHLTVKAIHP